MTDIFNRRAFFQKAAAASAAFTVLEPRIVFGSKANSAIGLGVIGCGNRGTYVATSIVENTDTRIAAIADLFPDKLQKGKEAFDKINTEKGFPQLDESRMFRGSKSYLKLLEDKNVDAVLIASPPFLHPEHLEAAVEAGKHAYCEKPVAVDAAGVKRVQRAGQKAQGRLSLAVGFQIRHATPFVEMVKRIQRGDIGDIVTVQGYYFAGGVSVPFLEGVSHDEARLRAWYWERALSGDIIVEQGIHVIDICNWTLNSHPLRASGMGGRKGLKEGNIWSHYLVNYEYPGEVHVNFQSTRLDPEYGDVCERFFGTKGIAEAHYSGGVFIKGENPWDSGSARGTEETLTKEQWATAAFKSALEDADPNKQKAFIESIKTGSFINEAAAGAETALSAILGRNAAYAGREMTWDQVAESNESLDPKIDLSQFDR